MAETDEERDHRLYRWWRNTRCPEQHALCFGHSPMYGYSDAAPQVSMNYGCATIAELREEVASHHSDLCRCWKHSVLRWHDRPLEDR